MSEAQIAKGSLYAPPKKSKKISPSKIIIYIILSSWAVTTIAPLLWVFMNSFKSTDEIISNSLALPTSLSFDNFIQLTRYELNIFKAFFNSIIISGSVVTLTLLVAGFASFAISRFRFRFSKVFRTYFIVSMLVPVFAVIIPDMFINQNIGINQTYFAVIIPQTAGFVNFAVLMMSGFMAGLPVELEEAAILDGASIPNIFFKIALPLCKPVFATVGIMVFLWSYNDLLMPMLFLPQKMYPVTVLVSQVQSLYTTNYGAMMAALTMTITPVIILYMFSQEYVVKGLTAGAVKG